MNRLNFSISVAILLILILSQNGCALYSGDTDADYYNRYKHDALVTQQENETHSSMCSGSIISDKHVLTAAHCVVKPYSNEIFDISEYLIEVTVGISELDDPNLQTVRAVETVFLPYRYVRKPDPENLPKVYGDIALLKVNKEFGLKTNSRIKALRLPSYIGSPYEEKINYQSRKHLKTTGFGIVGYGKIRNRQNEYKSVPINAKYLHYSSALVIEHGNCDHSSSISDVKLCVVLIHPKRLNSANCVGDSGGALFDESTKEIIGVASTTYGHCDVKVPAVFTRVIAFKDILEEAVNNDREIPFKSRRISFEDNKSYREKVKDKRYHKRFNSDENEDEYQPSQRVEPLRGDQGKTSMYAR